MLLKGQANLSFGVQPGYVQVRERFWVRQDETTKEKKNNLPNMPPTFAPPAMQNVCVFTFNWRMIKRRRAIESGVSGNSHSEEFSHCLFMLFWACGAARASAGCSLLFPCRADSCRNWPFHILIDFFFPSCWQEFLKYLACTQAALAGCSELHPAWGWALTGCADQPAQQNLYVLVTERLMEAGRDLGEPVRHSRGTGGEIWPVHSGRSIVALCCFTASAPNGYYE